MRCKGRTEVGSLSKHLKQYLNGDVYIPEAMRIPDKISDDSTKKGNAKRSTREKCCKDKRITNIEDARQVRVQSQEKGNALWVC